MPPRSSAPSLKTLCLMNLADNLERIWNKDLMDNHLAESFVPQLIHIRWESHTLTSAVLDTLLLPHLMTLKLSFCPELVHESLLHTIAVRCKKLTLLDLFGCKNVPAGSLVELVKALPCLTHLDLSKTKCNTQVLSAVAASCQRLRGLAVAECRCLNEKSLLHLAYNPAVGSFTGLRLQKLLAEGLVHDINLQEHIWAVAFLLLAMPSLTFLRHEFVTEAVCLIYGQQFDVAKLPPGFPSLRELARGRVVNPTNGAPLRPTLALQYMNDVFDWNLPEICGLCPNLERVVMVPGNSCAWAQWALSWRSLAHLTLTCHGKEQDLRELLTVTEILGGQLIDLSIRGFTWKDPFTFHTLLKHCANLHTFEVFFFLPEEEEEEPGRQPDDKAMDWEVNLSPLEFPQLYELNLAYSEREKPLPLQHVLVLRECLVSSMKHSPLLRYLDLSRLPFFMDDVFREVLSSPGPTLRHLSILTLDHVLISMDTVDLLLSSENHVFYICLEECLGIDMHKFNEVCKRIEREGFDLQIKIN